MGLFWSLTSALLWSTTFVAARHLLGSGRPDPVTLSAVRFLLGGLLLLGLGLSLPRHRRRLLSVSGRDLAQAAGLGLFGVAGMSLLLFAGQRFTSAVNAAVIMQLSPVFIVLLGWATGDGRPRVGAAAGILLAFTGSLLVAGVVTRQGFRFEVRNVQGELCVLGSSACWAVYSVFGRRLVLRLGGYAATTWAMLAGALLLALAWLLLPGARLLPAGAEDWGLVLYLAVFPTAVAFFAWYEAMRHLDMALLNVMQYLTPVFTFLLAWPLLGERLGGQAWAGVAAIMAGVLLVGRPSGQAARARRER